MTMMEKKNVQYNVLVFEKPIGYAKACNEGYKFLKKQEGGLTDYVFFANDDIMFLDNKWQKNLSSAIESEFYHSPTFKIENQIKKSNNLTSCYSRILALLRVCTNYSTILNLGTCILESVNN